MKFVSQGLSPDQFEEQLKQLTVLADDPGADHRTHLILANALHQAGNLKPDGGLRLPRAKQAYGSVHHPDQKYCNSRQLPKEFLVNTFALQALSSHA